MSEKIHKTAEDYLRGKYGAYRGSFSWRDEEKAFNAGIESQASVIAQLEADLAAALASQAQQESKQGCKECDGQTYIHSPTGEYLGECPFCTKEEDPYAYDVPTKDGTELAYAIYFNKYNNPLPEGAIPLYTSQQEPVRPWICPNFMLPPRSEEVLVYPMPNNVAHTAFHDGECWRVTEYENNYGYSLVALPDGFIKGWMPIPPAPEGE